MSDHCRLANDKTGVITRRAGPYSQSLSYSCRARSQEKLPGLSAMIPSLIRLQWCPLYSAHPPPSAPFLSHPKVLRTPCRVSASLTSHPISSPAATSLGMGEGKFKVGNLWDGVLCGWLNLAPGVSTCKTIGSCLK